MLLGQRGQDQQKRGDRIQGIGEDRIKGIGEARIKGIGEARIKGIGEDRRGEERIGQRLSDKERREDNLEIERKKRGLSQKTKTKPKNK